MDTWVVGILLLLGVVGLFVIETMATWGLGGWMEYRDRRSARTREEAEADLAQYGPTAVGLRDELLPDDLRQIVLDERDRAGRRWGRRRILH